MADKKLQPIGIFGSGIGGLSVLKEAVKTLPNEDFIYFCDQSHVPYGDKKPKKNIDCCYKFHRFHNFDFSG